jgi:hypothetical protein
VTGFDVGFDLEATDGRLIVIHAAGTARVIRVAGLDVASHSHATRDRLVVVDGPASLYARLNFHGRSPCLLFAVTIAALLKRAESRFRIAHAGKLFLWNSCGRITLAGVACVAT